MKFLFYDKGADYGVCACILLGFAIWIPTQEPIERVGTLLREVIE